MFASRWQCIRVNKNYREICFDKKAVKTFDLEGRPRPGGKGGGGVSSVYLQVIFSPRRYRI